MPSLSSLPKGDPGHSTLRILQVGIPAFENPGSGSQRTGCNFTHFNYDDPIVYPNQPGAAHLHMYFGNTATNAFSTAASIANSGNSACRGGIGNRSSYWVPAMLDGNNNVIMPIWQPGPEAHLQVYYKNGGVDSRTIKPFPAGLRIIAGNSKATGPGQQNGPMMIRCNNPTTGAYTENGGAIPSCAPGNEVGMILVFPQCWDGRNLDSPDHRSHMAYPVNNGGQFNVCPTSHPVPLPEVSFLYAFKVTQPTGTQGWHLSSDHYSSSLPGGYSIHADWFNGWDPQIEATWVKHCLNESRHCASGDLGQGEMLY